MPKNSGLKLFTMTWPSRRHQVEKNKTKAEEVENSRPLTATLEKPTILDISLIGIVDMSTVRKEFLNISNLCRFPLSLSIAKRKKTAVISRPLSLPSPEKLYPNYKKKKKRPETGAEESSICDDDESSLSSTSITSAKYQKCLGKSSVRSCGKLKRIEDVAVSEKKISDANNNKTFKIPRKRVQGSIIKLAEVEASIKADVKSTKLPEPCKTCGRPDQPERFHSHPVTPLRKSVKKAEEPPKMKSTVQKPIAMKYKSKNPQNKIEKRQPVVTTARKSSLPSQKLVHTPPNLNLSLSVSSNSNTPTRQGSGKRTLTCYICGREFGTASLPLHEPKCLEKWERENANLPVHLQRKMLIKPDGNLTQEQWNQFAWESSQTTLVSCLKCGRTFYPDRLIVHQRSCKITKDNNLNLDKACRVNLRLSSETCDALALRDASNYNQTDEIAVQKLTATMNAWKNVIQSLVPALLLLFLGSWSDRNNRRKPFFLGPMVGEACACLGLLLCTFYYHQLPMEFNLLFEAIPPSLTGGWFAWFMAIFSYVGGISSLQTRTLHIGAVNLFTNVSYTIGNALSGIFFKQIGFYGIYSLSVFIYLIGIAYGAVAVKELQNVELNGQETGRIDKDMSFWRDFFDFKHISETFKVAFHNGARNRKARIWTIMVLCIVVEGPIHGETSVLYMFVRYKFGWDEVDYSIYSTYYVITHMGGTLFSLILFTKVLKVDDAILGIVSSMSRIFAAFVYAFAPNSFVFYIGALVEIFNGTTFIAMRAIISKLVPPNELGKINSLFGLAEALTPIIYGPLYSIIYKYTINYLPGMFLLVGSALTLPSVFIFWWLYNEHKKDELLKNVEDNAKIIIADTELR